MSGGGVLIGESLLSYAAVAAEEEEVVAVGSNELMSSVESSYEMAKEFVCFLHVTWQNLSKPTVGCVHPEDKIQFDVQFLRASGQLVTVHDSIRFGLLSDVVVFTDFNRLHHTLALPLYTFDAQTSAMPFYLRFVYVVPPVFGSVRRSICLFQYRKALVTVEIPIGVALPPST